MIFMVKIPFLQWIKIMTWIYKYTHAKANSVAICKRLGHCNFSQELDKSLQNQNMDQIWTKES